MASHTTEINESPLKSQDKRRDGNPRCCLHGFTTSLEHDIAVSERISGELYIYISNTLQRKRKERWGFSPDLVTSIVHCCRQNSCNSRKPNPSAAAVTGLTSTPFKPQRTRTSDSALRRWVVHLWTFHGMRSLSFQNEILRESIELQICRTTLWQNIWILFRRGEQFHRTPECCAFHAMYSAGGIHLGNWRCTKKP